MKIDDNGVIREMTEEEIAQLGLNEPQQSADPLTEMVTAMSNATTVAQMRAAARTFLENTKEV